MTDDDVYFYLDISGPAPGGKIKIVNGHDAMELAKIIAGYVNGDTRIAVITGGHRIVATFNGRNDL